MNFAARAFCALTVLVLFGCASPERFAVSAPEIGERQRIAFASVEVKDVSLPSYASSDEITLQEVDGTLVSSGDVLWADAPERAISLEISGNLARMTGRRVASEPWPFEAFPDARLEVRFVDLLASADGIYRTSGQYFVGVPDGGRERSGLFDLAVTFDATAGPGALAAARGQLILDLSRFIARNGLR
ncbi:MAG: ABC-type transport auxiliary lipoprotein family protein [Pseudomonadota bacterium]